MVTENIKFDIESQNVATFNKMHQSDELILQPEFQRKAVWPYKAKVSLMETILLGYPIPEIYLSYQTDANGNQEVSVVDGQQRLTALLEFLAGDFALEDLEDQDLKGMYEGKYFADLPEEVRQQFFLYRFPIRRLSNLEDEVIRNVFARVNRVNFVLSDQEIRNALLPGQFSEFLKDAAAAELNEKSGLFSGSRRKRGGDIEFYAEVFSTCIFGISNKKYELDDRYNVLNSDFEQYESRADDFLRMLTCLESLDLWGRRTRWSNIVDMFSLLVAFWGRWVEASDVVETKADEISEMLNEFQNAVSEMRRSEADDDKSKLDNAISRLMDRFDVGYDDISSLISSYYSGIRNSSDLGSRRRRVSSLDSVLGAVLGGGLN